MRCAERGCDVLQCGAREAQTRAAAAAAASFLRANVGVGVWRS